MSDRLYLFAPAEVDTPWQFCLLSDEVESVEGSGLEAAAAAPMTREQELVVTLVVPGEHILRTTVSVPARSRRQLEMAVPYQVEEYLAEDVEQLHLAIGQRQPDDRVPVAVIAPDRLQAWLDGAMAAGLQINHARLDLEGLKPTDADLAVWVEDRRAWIASRNGDAVIVDRMLLAQVLSTMIAGHPGDAAMTMRLITAPDDDAVDLAQLDSLLAQERPVTIERERAVGTRMGLLAAGLDRSPGLELLQGRFAVARDQNQGWMRWRLVAGLAMAALALQLVVDLGRSVWLEQRAVTLRESSVELFREIHPERTRVVDPRRELQAILDGGGEEGGAAFLELLGASAQRIADLDDTQIQIRSLTFNAQRGDLAVDMMASGINTVDRFKADMEDNGFPVVIDSAVQEAQAVRARLRIRTGGAS
ncbi:MAG: hypothetical protein EA417_05115 [Gammaproteobacteria bacterium]|nr:MAG: hypothetical protein EA417_05115 [Gammaproteobacteria bacterium]